MPDLVRFKLCTLVYRCLHGLAPSYLSDLCLPATVHAHLRSSVTLERSLSIPRTKTKTLGLRGFYFASSAAWNALPVHLRDPELLLNSFKTKLKTHFISWPHLGYIHHLICSSSAPMRYFISWRVQVSVLSRGVVTEKALLPNESNLWNGKNEWIRRSCKNTISRKWKNIVKISKLLIC